MSDRVKLSPIQFRPITEQDHAICRNFSSGNTTMDNFLKNEAYSRHIAREGSTTLILYNGDLVGYFTLLRKDIRLEDGEEMGLGGLEVARLAISESVQNQGIGETAIEVIVEIAYMINERYIALDALFEKRGWYRKLGFKPAIEKEYEEGNEDSLVYMYIDLYDPKLVEDYYENP